VTPRTKEALDSERLEETAEGLRKLLDALYNEHNAPGRFSIWQHQTSSGIFLYLPRRNSDLVLFTPWGEMSYGRIDRDSLQELFSQRLSVEMVLEPSEGTQYGLRGHLYSLKSVDGYQVPPSILTLEEHALDAGIAQRSLSAHFAGHPFVG